MKKPRRLSTAARRTRTAAKWVSPVVLVIDIVIRIVALMGVPRNRRPTAAMAWLLAIFVAPVPGSLLFGLLGGTKLPQDRRDKQHEINDLILEETKELDDELSTPRPSWFASVSHLNRTLGSMPLLDGNAARLLPHYEGAIAAMTEAIDAARRYVHVEFYILSRDSVTEDFFDSLLRARDRGVKVRVLFDHWATISYPEGRRTRAWLRDNGIDFEEMLPFHPTKGMWRRPDLRNHRKIVVVDGDVAFTGSQNMIDRSYLKPGNQRRGLKWVDLMVRLDGPAAIGLDALFITDWYSETNELPDITDVEALNGEPRHPGTLECQVVPSGPGFEGENNLKLFNALVYSAQSRLIIASPYFVPDDSMLYAITTAAERGVDVQLFACEVADQYLVYHAQRSYYEALLRAGVRIFLYEKPMVLHSKHFTIDDEVAVIGSSNMDMRSFSLNFEVSLLVHGKEFVDDLRQIEDDYRRRSQEVTLDEWLKRKIPVQVLDNVARLTATLQ